MAHNPEEFKKAVQSVYNEEGEDAAVKFLVARGYSEDEADAYLAAEFGSTSKAPEEAEEESSDEETSNAPEGSVETSEQPKKSIAERLFGSKE